MPCLNYAYRNKSGLFCSGAIDSVSQYNPRCWLLNYEFTFYLALFLKANLPLRVTKFCGVVFVELTQCL